MNATGPPAVQRAIIWLVVVLAVILPGWGVLNYGWLAAVHERFWSDIAGRIHGPMTFRYLLQPAMALLAAVPDALQDARSGQNAACGSAPGRPQTPGGLLRHGLASVARVALLGVSMDVIYQFRVFDHFYPAEAVMMALLLAVIPYFALRWLVGIMARWWFARHDMEQRP